MLLQPKPRSRALPALLSNPHAFDLVHHSKHVRTPTHTGLHPSIDRGTVCVRPWISPVTPRELKVPRRIGIPASAISCSPRRTCPSNHSSQQHSTDYSQDSQFSRQFERPKQTTTPARIAPMITAEVRRDKGTGSRDGNQSSQHIPLYVGLTEMPKHHEQQQRQDRANGARLVFTAIPRFGDRMRQRLEPGLNPIQPEAE